MKTSTSAMKTSAREECGVWLDAAELKRKAKQKQVTHPISKLLNPFLGGGGYSLSVALNFTQTKREMPKTKQSSISAFFTPQRRVLNKMSTSEITNMDPVLPSISSTSTTCETTAPIPVAPGKKRGREIDLNFDDSKASQEPQTENVLEEEWQEQAASHIHSQKLSWPLEEQFEETNPPRSKRILRATSSLPDDSQPLPQAWSQDPLFTYSECSEGELELNDPKNITANELCDPELNYLNSLQSERAFNDCMNVEAKTSTQNTFKHNHSQTQDEEENGKFSSPQAPRKHSPASHIEPLSNSKSTEPNTASPLKHLAHPWRASKENIYENIYDSQWTKSSSSPRKKRLSGREVEEDSLAMLFTQDSEGFRVISHRGLQARSPLKDQNTMSPRKVRTSAYKSLVEEDEVLFTQDSQGNRVIKH